MANSDRVAQILADVQKPTNDGNSLAVRLVMAGRAALPVTGVGLSWMTDQGPGAMLAATDGHARLMEELQFSLGEGPCVDSSNTGRPVLHADLEQTASELWPGFTAGALEAGIAAVFAFPLQVGGIKIGVLDLYRNVAGPLEDSDLTEALAFAAAATSVLLHLQAAAAYGDMHPDLADTLVDRAEVHQATGMIAIQLGSNLADALTVLRARAFASGKPIVELAHDVVTRRLRFTDDEL
jgi:hypothetical protein